jgi:hypothetical protein
MRYLVTTQIKMANYIIGDFMIIKKEKKGDLNIYHVDKDYDDDKMEKKLNLLGLSIF